MRTRTLLASAALLSSPLLAQNGTLVEREPVEVSDRLRHRLTGRAGEPYLDRVQIERITYLSDGLKVRGYLAAPKADGPHPCVIYNRGGNREFGAIGASLAAEHLARIASWGFVVVASQYRGNGGGEGKEQFGGDDLNDVLNLVPLLGTLPGADPTRIGMMGWSRGGMMTYMALTRTRGISAAVIAAGPSDLTHEKESRPEMEDVYKDLIPDYDKNGDRLLALRSASHWPERLPRDVPILLLQGTADRRVDPLSTLEMARHLQELKRPYRLVMFEGDDHSMSEHQEEVWGLVRGWFDRFVRNRQPLPRLEPHGR